MKIMKIYAYSVDCNLKVVFPELFLHITILILCILYLGTRANYLNHLSTKHNLQLGNPQNLVYIDELIEKIEEKLNNLQCVYCEKTFPDRGILKEHMRKKMHKTINPHNREYDRYYIVNYLEPNKTWDILEKEDDNLPIESKSV